MSKLLEGKVALVTGSAAGLGRAIVEEFAGADAVGAGLDIDDSDPLPDGWFDIRGDVTVEEDIAFAAARITEDFGRLDAVVANAGPYRRGAKPGTSNSTSGTGYSQSMSAASSPR